MRIRPDLALGKVSGLSRAVKNKPNQLKTESPKRVVQEVPAFRDFWYQKVSRNSGITNFETNFSAKSQIGSKNFLESTFLANFSFFESQNTVFLTNFCQAGKNHEKGAKK